MKKILQLFTASILLVAIHANAQDRAVAKNFTFKDIKGNTVDLFTYLDQGKGVYIDLSATWCGPCWNYHNTKAMDKAWESNGPKGQPGVSATTKDDMIQLFIEGDPKTSTAQLSSASRDWTKGTNYPIINLSSADVTAYKAAGFSIPYYPSCAFVCPDRTLTKGESVDQSTASQIIALRNKCKPVATNIEKPNDKVSSILVYPNPANDVANLRFTLTEGSNVSVEVINTIGQVVYNKQLGNIGMGEQKVELNVSSLSKGLYFVNLVTGNSKIMAKLSIEK
jgi:hypothetical protein